MPEDFTPSKSLQPPDRIFSSPKSPEFTSRRMRPFTNVCAMATPPTPTAKPERTQNCPCGSGKPFGECCDPILTGQRLAATAEELMRARFTAHATHDFGFLHRTYRPTAGKPFVDAPAKPGTQWTRLVVHSHDPGGTPDIATVDFSAYGIEEGAEQVLHEKAEFVRQDGAWIYTRPLREGPPPIKLGVRKPGRNEPCPCGSGKKYKQCCLLKA